MVGKGQKIRRCTMGLAWERTGTSDRKVTRRVFAKMGRVRRWRSSGVVPKCSGMHEIRAPRRRQKANEGKLWRTAGIASNGWDGSSGDYPGKEYIRVGASGAATKRYVGTGILRYTKS